MRNRYLRRVVVVVVLVMAFGLNVSADNAFANDLGDDWIAGASTGVYASDTNESGPFPVTLRFTDDCEGCKQTVSSFSCNGPYGAATLQVVGEIDVIYNHKSDDGKWAYYDVVIHPRSGYSGGYYLEAGGQQKYKAYSAMKVPLKTGYDLSVQKRNIYNNADIGSATKEVENKTGWQTVAYDGLSGYKFVGWKVTKNHAVAETKYIVQRTKDEVGDYTSYVSDKYPKGDDYNANVVFYSNVDDTDSKKVFTKVHVDLQKNRKVYAYYAKACSLSKSAGDGSTITVNRIGGLYAIHKDNLGNDSSIYKKDKLQINFGTKSGWSLTSAKVNGSDFTSGKTYSVGGSGGNCENVTITTTAAKDGFKGRSRVGPTSNVSTKTTSTIQAGTAHAEYSCSGGCKVKLAHDLQRVKGSNQTTYAVLRTTNIPGVSSGKVVASGTKSNLTNGNMTQVRLSEEYNLGPGYFVCETMVFIGVPADGSKASTKVCAVGTSGAATTGLSMSVKSDGADIYQDYQSTIYARPGNVLTYRAIYTPNAQVYADSKTPKMIIDGGDICNNKYNEYNSSKKASEMFSNPCSGGTWNNGFSVTSSGFGSSSNINIKYDKNLTENGDKYVVGNSDKKTEFNEHTVAVSEVGATLAETASTNASDGVNTVPKSSKWEMKCLTGAAKDDSGQTIKGSDGKDAKETICYPALVVDTGIITAGPAVVKVPFNFNNKTCIASELASENDESGCLKGDVEKTAYSGEDEDFIIKISTEKRYNDVVKDEYATVVRNAKWKLEFCYNGECSWTGEKSGTLNADGLLEGHSVGKEMKINIPDLSAGNKVCLRSAVFPKDSGSFANTDSSYGYNSDNPDDWEYSAQRCYTVAKKPSLQVWGGNVYTDGAISTAVAAKKHLSGGSYSLTGGDVQRVFGSWGELGVISGGVVRGFASGAGTGYASNNNDGTLTPSFLGPNAGDVFGGSGNKSFCDRVPLTFANHACGSTTPGIGNSASVGSADDGKVAIVARYIYEDGVGGDINISLTENDEARLKGDNVYYYYGSNITIAESTIDLGTVKVVHAKNDVTIDGNLAYGGTYSTFEQMPKLVIYANNINIACHVNRVDALLVAENEVKTCSNSSDIKNRENSNQLAVNGAIIASKLIPNRTYGAATGANSIIPAEIVNFDPSLYRWGKSETGGDGSGTDIDSKQLEMVYTREIAPRL